MIKRKITALVFSLSLVLPDAALAASALMDKAARDENAGQSTILVAADSRRPDHGKSQHRDKRSENKKPEHKKPQQADKRGDHKKPQADRNGDHKKPQADRRGDHNKRDDRRGDHNKRDDRRGDNRRPSHSNKRNDRARDNGIHQRVGDEGRPPAQDR